MKLTLRKSRERGHADHGWLNSFHTFSFADYHDPRHMGFRSLRVINEDWIAPGKGFGTHPHRDMEIFTVMVEGTLEHKDSLGNGRQIAPGQIQVMCAGTGVTHSEFNPSQTEPCHLLQIWIHPERRGLTPSYTEWRPDPAKADAEKTLIISRDGREGSATMHQDADVWRLRMLAGESVTHEITAGRGAWLQIIEGTLDVNGTGIGAGDALCTEDAGTLVITPRAGKTDALLFDLA
ncbi:MAG: pirin family protein [Verrucomicrobiaceae bacterium]|nr:pirin family protein [Verrucomicrobiaceae bacterium]